MRRFVAVGILVALVGVASLLMFRGGGESAAQSRRPPQGATPGAGGPGSRQPMTVEVAATRRETVSEQVTVVGNLIGAATVEVVPKVSGRLQSVSVRLGDRVRRGETIARVEDREIREQVRQAEASFEVSRATIRQREADLNFAQTNVERARNLYNRQLLPRQSLDDAEAQHQAAAAQLDLARAQFQQAQARLEELRITLSNTNIPSPVDGFVAKRNLDPGAFASQNTPVAAVVDIRTVRLVANLVEKDVKRVQVGTPATLEVDAFLGETFHGRISRIAPVFDPATRTAEMEIEVPNPEARLKPGMYARVMLTVGTRQNALVVPRNAVVDVEGKRGVFVPQENRAQFLAVQTGLQDETRVEITNGLSEGARVITTGALALRDGDPIQLAGQRPAGQGAGAQNQQGRRPDAPRESTR